MDKVRRRLIQMGFLGMGSFLAEPFVKATIERGLLRHPGFNPYAKQSLDASQNLISFAKSNIGSIMSPFGVAYGSTQDAEIAVVTIRVMNLIHTPLCLKLGKITDSVSGEVAAFSGMSDHYKSNLNWDSRLQNNDTKSLLLAKGLDKVHSLPRWQKLRLNNWFGTLLQTGRNEMSGIEDNSGIPDGLSVSDLSEFPSEKEVALQVFMGVYQNITALNHSMKNTGFQMLAAGQKKGGDLNHHLDVTGLVKSPLGIVCLSMGENVESTDGDGLTGNKVVSSDLLSTVAIGKTVTEYTTLVRQATMTGFVDDSLTSKFDALGGIDKQVSQELIKHRTSLKNAVSNADSAAALEYTIHKAGGLGAGNVQHFGIDADSKVNQPARSEFLAQCKFVQAALEIPGKPFRNFSLLLNISDIDGGAFDTALSASGPRAKSLSYVEGTRQLALGMNLLAQVIKKHRNVYVMVISEGGRGANGGDNKVSHSFLMGPGGAGKLADHIYCNQQAVSSDSDPHTIEPNEGKNSAVNSPGLLTNGAGLRHPDGGVFCTEAGTSIGANQQDLNLSAVLVGLTRYLESSLGTEPTTIGLGNFVRIKTSAG